MRETTVLKRRWATLMVAFTTLGCAMTAATTVRAATIVRGPYLQLSSPTNITVCWRTDVPADSRVRYGANMGALTFTNDSPALVTNHFVTLTGLQPDTRYYYAVGTTAANLAGPTTNHFFWTHPWPGSEKPVRVWAFGDAGISLEGSTAAKNQRAVRDAFVKFNGTNTLHAWLLLGDNAMREGTDFQYQHNVFTVYPNQLSSSVVWSTLGNHDADGNKTDFVDTYPYFSIFHFPTNGEAGGVPSGTEHYYSFDVGMVHFICLDSVTASRAANGAMADWLRADLAANRSRWTVAFWHFPPYTKGGYDSDARDGLVEMRENIGPIIEAGGVDLVLCGHSHVYERSHLINGHYGLASNFDTNTMIVQPGSGRETNGAGAYLKPDQLGEPAIGNRGTIYIVAGIGGEFTDVGLLNHPAMFHSQRLIGSVVLDFASNRLDAILLPTNGVPADWFTILKEGTHPPILTEAAMAAPGAIQFTVQGRAYRTNIVEAADSLVEPVSWYPVSTNVAPAATFNVTNQIPPGMPVHYFRVRRP